jgi:hypothetical protein
MTQDELEKMAKQTAAFGVHPSGEYIYSFYTEQLQAFARLVAEHERNECAKVCDELETNSDAEFYGYEFSKAIRERGNP